MAESHEVEGHSRAAVSLRYSNCGDFFATTSADKTCHIYRSSDGQLLHSFEHSLGVNASAWFPNAHVGTCSDDKTIKIWDTEAVRHVCLK